MKLPWNKSNEPEIPEQPKLIYILQQNRVIPEDTIMIHEDLYRNRVNLNSSEPKPIFLKYNDVLFRTTLVDTLTGKKISYKRAECANNCILARRIVIEGLDIESQYNEDLISEERVQEFYSTFKNESMKNIGTTRSIVCVLQVIPRELILKEVEVSEFYQKRQEEMQKEYKENKKRLEKDHDATLNMEKEHYTLLLDERDDRIKRLEKEKQDIREDYEKKMDELRQKYEDKIDELHDRFEKKLYSKQVKEKAKRYNGGVGPKKVIGESLLQAFESNKEKNNEEEKKEE